MGDRGRGFPPRVREIAQMEERIWLEAHLRLSVVRGALLRVLLQVQRQGWPKNEEGGML
jgi:hypothetical protein